jgi:hypothetical protein
MAMDVLLYPFHSKKLLCPIRPSHMSPLKPFEQRFLHFRQCSALYLKAAACTIPLPADGWQWDGASSSLHFSAFSRQKSHPLNMGGFLSQLMKSRNIVS